MQAVVNVSMCFFAYFKTDEDLSEHESTALALVLTAIKGILEGLSIKEM